MEPQLGREEQANRERSPEVPAAEFSTRWRISTYLGAMTRRALRIAARTLLCAAALALGAGLAHLTPPAAPMTAQEEALVPPAPLDDPGAPTPLSPAHDPPSSVGSQAPARSRVEPAPSIPTDAFARTLREGMIVGGGTPHRLILFTFDDGPDHRYTPGLLDVLEAHGIRAVFFLTSRRFAGESPRARQLAEIAREIVRRGHIVGSHTMDHAQLPLLHGPALHEQIVGTEEVFARVLGERPWLVRPPGGGRSPRIDAYLASRGYTQVLWNLGTGDFQVRTSEEVLRTFQRVLWRREHENGERGGVVLLHDIHRWSVEAFPRIVAWLEERNCELHAEGEELYDVVGEPRLFFTPRGEAGTSDLAPLAEPDPQWLAERQRALHERAETRCARLAMR